MRKTPVYLSSVLLACLLIGSCVRDINERNKHSDESRAAEIQAARDYFEKFVASTRAGHVSGHSHGSGLDPADFSSDWEAAVVSGDIESMVSVDVDIDAGYAN